MDSKQSRITRLGGPGQFLLEGPYDVIHDVIVCKSYIFADSQGSRLFFPLVENVLTQMHIHSPLREENLWYEYWSVFLLRKNISQAREWLGNKQHSPEQYGDTKDYKQKHRKKNMSI